MNLPQRGEIWLVNLEPTMGAEIKKVRPAIIISNDINNEYSSTITVLPVTTDKDNKSYPFEVFIPRGAGNLTQNSKVKCQQIRTIDKMRLIKLYGSLDQEYFKKIEKAVLIHLGID